jgi:hypothetical protein
VAGERRKFPLLSGNSPSLRRNNRTTPIDLRPRPSLLLDPRRPHSSFLPRRAPPPTRAMMITNATPSPRSRVVTVAATQFPVTDSPEKNRILAESLIRLAHAEGGANIVLLPELFDGIYFCRDQDVDNFSLARPSGLNENPLLSRFRDVSEELRLVLPISFFEKSNMAYYNSVAVFDCGRYLGVYRKSHIPGKGKISPLLVDGSGGCSYAIFNDLVCTMPA